MSDSCKKGWQVGAQEFDNLLLVFCFIANLFLPLYLNIYPVSLCTQTSIIYISLYLNIHPFPLFVLEQPLFSHLYTWAFFILVLQTIWPDLGWWDSTRQRRGDAGCFDGRRQAELGCGQRSFLQGWSKQKISRNYRSVTYFYFVFGLAFYSLSLSLSALKSKDWQEKCCL